MCPNRWAKKSLIQEKILLQVEAFFSSSTEIFLETTKVQVCLIKTGGLRCHKLCICPSKLETMGIIFKPPWETLRQTQSSQSIGLNNFDRKGLACWNVLCLSCHAHRQAMWWTWRRGCCCPSVRAQPPPPVIPLPCHVMPPTCTALLMLAHNSETGDAVEILHMLQPASLTDVDRRWSEMQINDVGHPVTFTYDWYISASEFWTGVTSRWHFSF